MIGSRPGRAALIVAAAAAAALAGGAGAGASPAAPTRSCSAVAAAQLAAWAPDTAGAIAYAHRRHGDISFAVRAGTRDWGYRSHHVVVTASVLKAMLLVAYLDLPSVRDRPLTPTDTALLIPMIRRSDNTAATRVVAIVGDGRLVALARRVGMRNFRPAPIWGLSQTTADDQARYFQRIDSYLAPMHRGWALGQLASIIRAQRWGIGRVPLAGWSCTSRAGGDRGRDASTTRSRCSCMAAAASRSR